MTKDRIKKYFLGELSEAANNSFEEEAARDAELFEQTQIIENEIIDDYLQGKLLSAEQTLFEENYLITQPRHKKVKFARMLLAEMQKQSPKAAKTAAIAERKTTGQSVFANFRYSRAFAFGITAIIFIGAFLFIWFNQQSKTDVARQRNSNQVPPINESNSAGSNLKSGDSEIKTGSNSEKPKLPRESNSPQVTPAPETKTVITPTPKSIESPKPAFASFVLAPGSLRGSGEQSIKIPAAADKINLHLKLPLDAAKFRSYQAAIKNVGGTTVFSVSNLNSLDLILPAAKLANETYVIFLAGNTASNPAESVAEYTFRVYR